MRKYLVIIPLLISSALAESQTSDKVEERKRGYLSLSVGASKFNKVTQENDSEDSGFHIKSNVSKSRVSPALSIAFGSYISEKVRLGVSLDYLKVNFKNSSINSGSFLIPYPEDESFIFTKNMNIKLQRKASIYSAMVNTYIDLPVIENVELFVGGGIGVARIKENLKCNASSFITHADYDGNVIGRKQHNIPQSTKGVSNHFAYSLTVGTSFKVTPTVNLDIAYNYKDFGKTENDKDDLDNIYTPTRYRGHMLMAGIRVGL